MILLRMISARVTPESGIDPDAQAFLTAIANTDPTIETAINDLVLAFKAASIWTKMNAIYPMVGGTATSHKYNLKDPQDTDGAFRVVFNGTWTHSATGALPNGAAGTFGDTKLNAQTVLAQNDNHLAVYSRTNNATDAVDIGCSDGSRHLDIEIKYGGDRWYTNNAGYQSGVAYVTTAGLFTTSRTGSGNYSGYRNTTAELNNIPAASTGEINFNIYISSLNNNGVNGAFPSNRQVAFASIGSGLTSGDVTPFYNAVQACQTTLGRQV